MNFYAGGAKAGGVGTATMAFDALPMIAAKSLQIGLEILKLRPARNDFAHEPTFWHDLQPEPPNVLQCACDQSISEGPSAHRNRHLGVIDGHHVPREPIVGNSKTGRRIQLKPVFFRVVSNAGVFRVGQGDLLNHRTR